MPNSFGLLRFFGLRQQNVHCTNWLFRKRTLRWNTGIGKGRMEGEAEARKGLRTGYVYALFYVRKKASILQLRFVLQWVSRTNGLKDLILKFFSWVQPWKRGAAAPARRRKGRPYGPDCASAEVGANSPGLFFPKPGLVIPKPGFEFSIPGFEFSIAGSEISVAATGTLHRRTDCPHASGRLYRAVAPNKAEGFENEIVQLVFPWFSVPNRGHAEGLKDFFREINTYGYGFTRRNGGRGEAGPRCPRGDARPGVRASSSPYRGRRGRKSGDSLRRGS